jgi:hypothetical protein
LIPALVGVQGDLYLVCLSVIFKCQLVDVSRDLMIALCICRGHIVTRRSLPNLTSTSFIQLEWKDELRLKQNMNISAFALEARTHSTSSDANSKVNTGSLLSTLGSDIDKGIRRSCIFEEQDNLTYPIDASYLTATTPQIDVIFSALIPESFIILLNIASIRYEHHQYLSCRDILERLVSSLLVRVQDNGACIKACFLLTEVLLRLWGDIAACHTEEQAHDLHGQSIRTLSTAEKYISQLFTSLVPADPDYLVAPNQGTMDLKDIMENILKYRIQLYH